MAKVTDQFDRIKSPLFACDFSPPRGADPKLFDRLLPLEADYLCAAYNPGMAVRVDSIAAARIASERTGRDVIFNLSTRDMNKISFQSQLLGAQAMGLDNVVVLRGDPFGERQRSDNVISVHDFSTTEAIAAIAQMNLGYDYRGAALQNRTDICIGAGIDLNRQTSSEANLTLRKSMAGVHFFITQPVYQIDTYHRFFETFFAASGENLSQPIFWGLQVLEPDGIVFGSVPDALVKDLANGRSGEDIAVATGRALLSAGAAGFYVVPPIRRNGSRDYGVASSVIKQLRAMILD